MTSTTYLKFMSHTTSANLAIYFGIHGRVMCTSAACVSASQAIGQGYETIGCGLVDVMVCGGAEELHFSHAAVFDMLHAASKAFNTTPELTPRPFDQRRDGLVVGEGAGTLVLEEYERAETAGKKIYAEIIGYGTNCDGTHVTNPSGRRHARRDGARAEVGEPAAPSRSTTSTRTRPARAIGDIAESQATFKLFGDRVPVSSFKGHIGHTLGACGGIETAFVDRDAARGLDRADPQPRGRRRQLRAARLRDGRGAQREAEARDVQQVRVRRHQHEPGV